MPSNPILDALTAERLVQIAAEQREIARRCDEMNVAHHALELAAICEAVARAEWEMRAEYRAWTKKECGFQAIAATGIQQCCPLAVELSDKCYPTLIAALSALGAVGAEEKHDGRE